MTSVERQPDTWNKWWRRLAPSGAEGAGEGGEGKAPDRSARLRYLAVLLLLGAGLMLFANPREPREEEAAGSAAFPANGAAVVQSSYEGFVDELERQVTLAVSQIAGVGDVVVTIVPETSPLKVLAEEVTERESESTGAEGAEGARREWSVTRRPVTVTGDDGRRQEPVLLYTRNPEIAGVLVVADGAREPGIRYLIVRAVSTALGIPPHKVEAVPKKE